MEDNRFEVSGRCPKTGKPYLTPFWTSQASQPPQYASCTCCPAKNPEEELRRRRNKEGA